MKKAILAFILLFSVSSFANECVINSKYKELESGINKEDICKASLYALTGQMQFSGQELLIEAKGARGIYDVELTKIEMSVEGNEIYSGKGVLKWNPDETTVILSE
ncbi:MAG: hypothetical protein VX642_07295 [Bdellovibrionota bacterium]|nr:hypothetical protein [Bdellovibrionota bacterium]